MDLDIPITIVGCNYPDGRLEVIHEGIALPYRPSTSCARFTDRRLSRTKRLGAALGLLVMLQAGRDLYRNQHGPWRTG
jgi:hypothetical protein